MSDARYSPEANAKRRKANTDRQKKKREAKAKEIEKQLEILEYSEETNVVSRADYLPHVQRNKENGNPAIGQALRNAMMFWSCEPVRSDDELCERLAWFFDTCSETNQLPTYEKMCLACGYSRSWMSDILSGRSKGFSSLTTEILKKAREILATADGELALQSKIQPVVYMFRSKNFYGMTDRQDVVVTPNNPLGDYDDPSTIAEKYKQLPKK